MLKTSMAPDPTRDAPKGHGEHQNPGQVAVYPGRALVDNRFNRFPMTFRVLGTCCAHAKAWTATFYVNQSTMSKILQCSQQAVSQHMNKLAKFGYLEKLRKEGPSRQWGDQGSLWRVIYDPSLSYKQVLAMRPKEVELTEQEEFAAMNKTLKIIANTGAKGTQKQGDTQGTEPVDNSTLYKPHLVQHHKLDLVHNNSDRTIRKEVKEEECKRLCEEYKELMQSIHGRPWRYDIRQTHLARDILMQKEAAEFLTHAKQQLQWMKDNGKEPAISLKYYLTVYDNKDKPKDSTDILRQVTSRMRMNR